MEIEKKEAFSHCKLDKGRPKLFMTWKLNFDTQSHCYQPNWKLIGKNPLIKIVKLVTLFLNLGFYLMHDSMIGSSFNGNLKWWIGFNYVCSLLFFFCFAVLHLSLKQPHAFHFVDSSLRGYFSQKLRADEFPENKFAFLFLVCGFPHIKFFCFHLPCSAQMFYFSIDDDRRLQVRIFFLHENQLRKERLHGIFN